MADHLLFNTIIEFFEEDNWDFQWVAGHSVLSLPYSGEHGKWICYAQAREDQQQIVFYSVLPANTPATKRHLMAELITRANYGMVIGNFEMDFDDGEIRYKTSVDVEGSELSLPLIRQLVYANISITDHYFPAIMRVIYSDVTPKEALEHLYLESMDDLNDLDEDDDLELDDGMMTDEEEDALFDAFDDEYDDYDDDDEYDDDDYDDDAFGYLDDDFEDEEEEEDDYDDPLNGNGSVPH